MASTKSHNFSINEMTSLRYGELELLICLHFPMAATRIVYHFDVASGPFKWPGSALMWPSGTLKNPFRT